MRDQVFAHSDAHSHEIAGFNYGGSTVKLYKYAFDPLTMEDTSLLLVIIGKWISHLNSLRASAKQQGDPVKKGATKKPETAK